MVIKVKSEKAMRNVGARLASYLHGGEVIELVGDVGAGKTVFVKGLATGLKVAGDVQSPSFTISRVYDAAGGLRLAHYDFYRLHDAGIMSDELSETARDDRTVTVIEWADVVRGVLPDDRLTIAFLPVAPTARQLTVVGYGPLSQRLIKALA